MPKKIKFKRVKVKVQGPKTLLLITGLTFLIAMLFSYIFEVLLTDVPLLIAFFLLITEASRRITAALANSAG